MRLHNLLFMQLKNRVMKNVFLLLMIPILAAGQKISLQECFEMAIQHHPLNDKLERIDDIHSLKIQNYKMKRLPEMSLSAQMTYQDPVIGIDNPMFPSSAPDQYKTWIDVRQNIYDGGYVRSLMDIERQNEKTAYLEQELSIDLVKYGITELYFNILIVDIQLAQSAILHEELTERLRNAKSLVDAGVITLNNYNGIKVEILKVEQQQNALKMNREGLISVLKRYTGISSDDSLSIMEPEIESFESIDIARKEYELFEANKSKILLYQKQTGTMLRPKLFGFTQIGYGNPGLNILNDSFEPFYIVGAGLSWNIYDWGKTKKSKQVQEILYNNIEDEKNKFNQDIHVLIDKTLSEIKAYEVMIESDPQIIEICSNNEIVAESQFLNGTLNATEYLSEINKKKQAVLAYEMHKIKRKQAMANLNLIIGKF